jgi:hypothetical protein
MGSIGKPRCLSRRVTFFALSTFSCNSIFALLKLPSSEPYIDTESCLYGQFATQVQKQRKTWTAISLEVPKFILNLTY